MNKPRKNISKLSFSNKNPDVFTPSKLRQPLQKPFTFFREFSKRKPDSLKELPVPKTLNRERMTTLRPFQQKSSTSRQKENITKGTTLGKTPQFTEKTPDKPRKPKHFDDEPIAEPEPQIDYHSPGSNPKTHAFHSWLFQKIDPKVRAARRKKFFGSGRKKRQAKGKDILRTPVNDLSHLAFQAFAGKDELAGLWPGSIHRPSPLSISRTSEKDPGMGKGIEHSRGEAQHQLMDKVLQSRDKRDSTHHPSLQDGAKISINLGVKRITIDEPSLLESMVSPSISARESSSLGTLASPVIQTIIFSNHSLTAAFCLFLFLVLLVGSGLHCLIFRHHVTK